MMHLQSVELAWKIIEADYDEADNFTRELQLGLLGLTAEEWQSAVRFIRSVCCGLGTSLVIIGKEKTPVLLVWSYGH